LGLLRALLLGSRGDLRLVQRGGRTAGRRGGRFGLGRLLLGGLALALLLFGELGGLACSQLFLALALLLAQLDLLRIERGRGGRRRRLRGLALLRFALDEDAVLLGLTGAGGRPAAGVRLLDDLGGLLAGERDLVLRLGRTVRAAQVVQQLRLVLLGEHVLRDALVHARGAQLLEQLRRRDLQLACELSDARLCHVTFLLLRKPVLARLHDEGLGALGVDRGHLDQVVEREVGEVVARLHSRGGELRREVLVHALEAEQRRVEVLGLLLARDRLHQQRVLRAAAKLVDRRLVEALDLHHLVDRYVGDLLQRGESFLDEGVRHL